MEIGWIDFSKTDRDNVLSVLDLLGKGTLDDLGIASVRDAYSNLFFPGTSTIQTRARYFFIVPYIFKDLYKKYEKKSIDCQTVYDDFKRAEMLCAKKLLNEKNKDQKGIVGKRSLQNGGKWVQRAPSSIYWSGLKRYGIITSDKSIDDIIEDISSKSNNDDLKGLGNKKDKHESFIENDISFSVNVIYDEHWKNDMNIGLTPKEGQTLKEHIVSSCENTLFAYLLHEVPNEDLKKVVACKRFSDLKEVIEIPEKFWKDYDTAVAFSEFMFILILIYNVCVLNIPNDKAKNYLYASNLKECSKIDLDSLRGLKDAGLKTFLSNSKEYMEKEDIKGLKEVIISWEHDLKGSKAKSSQGSTFGPDDWFGGVLDYRFSNAKNIISDILDSESNSTGGE